jgi:hypothetical protein
MIQSESDEQALAFLADGVCRDLQANGTDLRMWRYDDESHVDSVSVSSDDRARWILDRLEGRALTDAVPFTGEAPQVLTTCVGTDAPPVVPPTVEPPAPSVPLAPTPAAPPATPIAGAPTFVG